MIIIGSDGQPRTKQDLEPVLDRVVILDRIREKLPTLKVGYPGGSVGNDHLRQRAQSDTLIPRDVGLEANDVTTLNLALVQRQFGLHRHDHVRLDFLVSPISEIERGQDDNRTSLIESEASSWHPVHTRVDQREHF